MAEVLVTSLADIDKQFAPKPAYYVQHEVWLASIAGEVEKQYNKQREEGQPELRCVVQESRKLDSGYWTSPSLDVLLDDTTVRGVYINFEAERSGGSSWNRKATGRMRCTVGDYGDRQSFPQRKDGTFSHDKIAQKLLGRVWAAIREAKLNEQKKSNATMVAELQKKFCISEYSDAVCASYYLRDPFGKNGRECVAPEGKVFVKVGTKTLTPEQADRLLSFLQTL